MIQDQQLQHTINLEAKYGRDEAAKMLGVEADTIRRYGGMAKKKGLVPEEESPVKLPSIFIMDVENSPTLAAVWGMWKQNVNLAAITEEWHLISWAGKYLFDTEMHSDVLTSEEAISGDDKRIMESLWYHLDKCDILIGHNMQNFDVLKSNTRFVLNGIMPPSPYQVVDTLLAARKNFAFTSNKLDYLCKQFGVEGKADNGGMQRWMDCLKGEPHALLEMEKYNRQDIVATEELYMSMLPYIKNHPNMALYMDQQSDACYKCGSTDIEWLNEKYYYTGVNKYPVYQCRHCHSYGRSRYSAMSKDDRKHITSPIAR